MSTFHINKNMFVCLPLVKGPARYARISLKRRRVFLRNKNSNSHAAKYLYTLEIEEAEIRGTSFRILPATQ